MINSAAQNHCLPGQKDAYDDYITKVVWFGRDGECVDTRLKTGSTFASFWTALLPTPKIRDVISEPNMEWMNNN